MGSLTGESKQEQFYNNQRSAFEQLSECKGFSYLVQYWELELDEAANALSKISEWDIAIGRLQWRVASARDFLEFTERILE